MPFIKLDPHPLQDLPSHPYLQGQGTKQLPSLMQTVLHEANPHLNKLHTSLRADPKLRPSPPSSTNIKLSQGWHEGEFWVCRQSDHQDTPTAGTASWHEFQAGLRHNHAEHEMQYTPSVTKVVQLLNWEQNGSWDPSLPLEVDGTVYKDFIVELNLIVHTFHPPALIRPRAFISCTVSATFEMVSNELNIQPHGTEGFITIQVPFRLPDPTDTAVYLQLCAEIKGSVPPRTVFAHYASIERVELLPPPSGHSNRIVRWTMATASEAGGKIPQWVQRNWTLGGVPRAVVADVGLFIGWVKEQREAQLEG